MTFEVYTRGRQRTIEIRRSGARAPIGDCQVALDGRTMDVSVSAIGDRWSVLVGTRSYEASVERGANGERLVHVNGLAVPATIANLRTTPSRDAGRGSVSAGTRTITAPMPGRIVTVMVAAGDVVNAHQGLLVIEAMKMENELKAPRSGRVVDVRVAEGMSVEAKAVLIVME